MRLIDTTTGQVVAEDLRLAESAWSRFRGLMLRAPLPPGEGLDIRPCGSIHMCFMRFAVDAVFYDESGHVTKVARNVRPWIGIAFGGRGARGVVELSAGAAAGVEAGHLLRFDEAFSVDEKLAA